MPRRPDRPPGPSPRAERSEVRWFVPGDAPGRLRPAGRPMRRRDAYELDSLGLHHAVKRRGASTVLERKERVGRVELVRPGGVEGFAERWSKERFRDRWLLEAGRWVEVSKAVWRTKELEVARVAVDATGEVAWTLCVDLSHATSRDASELLGAWRDAIDARGERSSYPAWLTALPGARATVEA